jgi:di/tricarboxylate transporter
MERPDLTFDMVLTLIVALGALVLFIWGRPRAEIVALLTMAALILFGLVTPAQGTSGFANEATLTVALMMVLAGGLARTGAIDLLGQWVSRLAGKSEIRLIAVVLLVTIPASAFINNTPVVIVLLPVVMGFARRTGLPPSRLLMPLSFGSQLGGTLTLIGTSTNLLVAALVVDLGMERFHLFTITPPAFLLMLLGVGYMLTVGRWLAPSRATSASLLATYELREYLTSIEVEPDAAVADRTLAELRFEQRFGLQVLSIERGDMRIAFPNGSTRLHGGDRLIVRGRVPDLAQVKSLAGLSITGGSPALEEGINQELTTELGEIIVPPRSRVVGRTLTDLGFRARYRLNVLAIQRHGAPEHAPVGTIPLEAGDILLAQGSHEAMHELHRRGEFSLLGALDLPARRERRLRIAVPIVVGVVLLAATNLVPILVAALIGALAMILTGCIRAEEAYRDIDWMVIVLLGAIIPLGIAMSVSGAAEYIAVTLVDALRGWGPYAILGMFYLLTSLLTGMMSNNATAVVLTPIAFAVASGLGVSPMPFVVATMLAASNAFMSPIGYQTNMFIYGPGGYAFTDYIRVGGPLNVLMVVAATFAIPLFFPF